MRHVWPHPIMARHADSLSINIDLKQQSWKSQADYNFNLDFAINELHWLLYKYALSAVCIVLYWKWETNYCQILDYCLLTSMGNQMVTSEIRKYFHARFVKIPIISRAFRQGKLFEFWQNAREIISQFHEYTIWLPFNIMGDKLRLQS